MEFDIAAFRLAFPEFANAAKYPDSMITFWSGLAKGMLIECRWGSVYSQGLSLYVAHEITIAARNALMGAMGGTPGQGVGLRSGKTVGSTSTTFDTNNTVEKDAGYWNLTTYGQQYIRLARMIGAGALQV
jgi:hypothetical protein